jgi:uncharacterized protein
MVSLDEGPVMMTDLVDYEPGSIHIGQRVEMTYEDVTDQITLPMFRPTSTAG